MYTILVTESNELVTTHKSAIMCRSNFVDKLRFLADPIYKDLDMSTFTVCMEYVSPASRLYRTEILTPSSELYKEKLEYIVPFDTKLTQEVGLVEVQLTFISVVLEADGTGKQYVRKTKPTTIEILPSSAWSDIVPDSTLTALDQRLVKTEAMIKALQSVSETLYTNKAEDLRVYQDTNELQLVGGDGTPIGSKVSVVLPAINDGDYDGNYNGILELDEILI